MRREAMKRFTREFQYRDADHRPQARRLVGAGDARFQYDHACIVAERGVLEALEGFLEWKIILQFGSIKVIEFFPLFL